MILREYKLKNGENVNAFVADNGYLEITEEALSIMVNGWNEGYEKGKEDGKREVWEDIEKIIDGMSDPVATLKKIIESRQQDTKK